LFITHGGLLSTQETIHWGVPVVGIPMLADQNLNMAQAVSRGYGIQLDFANITAELLEWALKEVLENSRYCVCTDFYNSIHGLLNASHNPFYRFYINSL
jgi:glucuronosyltransferase